jgi:hypothetical protein
MQKWLSRSRRPLRASAGFGRRRCRRVDERDGELVVERRLLARVTVRVVEPGVLVRDLLADLRLAPGKGLIL